MSEGLKALLEAAQFIEQQEKLKLSPQAATVIPAILNEQQQRFIVHAYDATIAAAAAAASSNTTTTTTTTNGYLNGGSINIRNSNIRHGNTGSLQVSSSAPAAAATFQHVNGHHNNNNHNNNNNNGGSSSTTASSLHSASLAATKVLTNGTNIASASALSSSSSSSTTTATTNGHHLPLHHHPHLNLNHLNHQQQQNSQLLNANHHEYGVNGNGGSNGTSSTVVIATSPSSTGATSGNILQQTSFNGRSSEGRITANNHHQLHIQNGNSMMVDDVSPTHHSFATNLLSSQNSPPRNVSSSLGSSTGSHYLHMINAASSQQAGLTGSGANHIAHATPRRRTISSTSNGAGTREVHNKLEKNRRAHLKECYEALKNQLSLKDEDRRKTSNLAILGEALKCVQSFQKRNQELEAEWEHLANDKINLQKRIVSLKRELGPKYEQIFSGIFPDIEIGSIPSERETIIDTHSLSSGRGSTLYSSSSSLSSGGSNGSSSSSSGGSGSNTMSSPVGAGLQTAMPTTISPVINKINNNISNINSTSPISINSNSNVVIQQQLQHQRKNASINTTIQAVAIPNHQCGGGGGGMSSPPAGSPTALATFGSSLPLSLTAKNISATAVTRGSPTPSTPSPSPSSSSGVSSSSSLISSSPPINGVISNGRNVTVNIPNGLKLQAAAVPAGAAGGINGNNNGTSTSAAATILATTAPPAAQGHNNTNNVLGNQQPQQQQHHNSRKKNLALSNNNNGNATESKNNHQQQQQQQHQHANEDGEQPAKFLKVFNSSTATATNGHHHHHHLGHTQAQAQLHDIKTSGQKLLLTSNGGIIQSGGCGGNNNNNNNNNMGGTLTAAAVAAINKTINNGAVTYAATPAATITSTTTSELCRLPGGAELNILPTNGLKVSSGGGTGSVATAFYHANGKITFVNGPPTHHHPHAHQYQYQQHPPSTPLPNSTTITSNGTTTITNGFLLKDATSVTPLLVSAAASSNTAASSVNGLHFAGNFAQLLAAANNTTAAANTNAGHSNNATANIPATAALVPMATNFQPITESKTKNNNKPSIVTWRTGATTTN